LLIYPGGFELLAALLRPKMPLLVDIACTKIILHMLGINMDKPVYDLTPHRINIADIIEERQCTTLSHTDLWD
jgi:hypothetical protein